MSGTGARWDVGNAHADLDLAVRGEGMSPVFQPIVSLPGVTTVGFEALARWPRHPQSVFTHAAATQRVTELDRLCIDRAVDVALRGDRTTITAVAVALLGRMPEHRQHAARRRHHGDLNS